MERRICLIVNPAAGGGRSARALPRVEQALDRLGVQRVTRPTRDLEHARELARDAVADGRIPVTLSGDGLVGCVAGVLRELPDATLGVLPGGRGNDFARVLGIPLDPVDACEVIAHGVPRPVDVGDVGGRTFIGIASAGFDSDANRIANEAPAWLGGLVYAYGALRALAAWRPARFELELDGERHSFSGYSVAAANSPAYGGGMFLAPDAELDDGQLDIVTSGETSKRHALVSLPKIFKGTHVDEAHVRIFRCRQVRIAADRPFTLYADGDPIAQLPAEVGVVRHALRVLVPAGESGSPPDRTGRGGAEPPRDAGPPSMRS